MTEALRNPGDALAHDVVVIGSGAAGLTAALALAETRRVLVPVSYTHLTLPTNREG